MDQEQFTRNFRRECDGSFFRDNVRNIISDKLFVNNLIQRFDLTDQIKEETRKIVPTLVENKLNHFAVHHLPTLVNNQLAIQLPYYLDNNDKMQRILQKHSEVLELKLDSKAREIMTKVVNEPKFNQLSNLHFSEMDRKFDHKMTEYDHRFNEKLKMVDNLDQRLTKIDDEIKEIDDGLLVTSMISITALGFSLFQYFNK